MADLGVPVEDRILVLNILWGLNQCFEHVGSIIRCYSPFSNFLKVRGDLLLEKIHMDSTGPPVAPMALYTNVASPTAKPPSSTPSRPPYGGTGGNRTKYHNKNRNSGNGGGHNGKNSTGGGGRGGSSGQPPPHFRRQDQHTVADLQPLVAGAHDYIPQPVPAGQQRLQAFVAAPGLYASLSLLSEPHPQQ
jgi:hypothetical protein